MSIDLHNLKGKIRSPVESTVFRARQGSFSVKSTIPQEVANALDIDSFDNVVIEWRIFFPEDYPKSPALAIVTKKEEKENDESA